MLQLDTAPFFNSAHFAQKVEFAGVQKPVMGIFDDAYVASDVGELGMGTTRPTLLVSTSQVPAGVRGMQLQTGGKHFTVEDTQPDGTGMTLLVLEVLRA